MPFLGQEEQLREFQDRFKFLNIALLAGLGLILSRLIFLQILQGDKMRSYSEENRIKRVRIASPRGMLFDRHGVLLVDNRPSFDLEITPQYLSESKQPDEVLSRLSQLISQPVSEIEDILEKNRNQAKFLPVKIKTDLPREEVAKIESWKIDMPGVAIETEIQRTTVYDEIGSHLLGYIGRVNSSELPGLLKQKMDYQIGDSIGKTGIEKQFEKILRGADGQELVEVDAVGRRIRNEKKGRVLSEKIDHPAVPGRNLYLTIDQDLQQVANQAFGEKVGSLVALNPKTGEILAVVSKPGFNPTVFSRGISADIWKMLLENPNQPLRDKTIQDHYSPGSVFKVITAIAGLEEGAITRNTKFNCSGVIQLGRRPYHCHREKGHGDMDVVTAISQSCNVFFYRLAQKLKSVDVLSRWANAFGLGARTGITLPREVPGLIPTEKWKEDRFGKPWTQGETLSVAIGQSFVLTTAMQLASVYSAIANGGSLYRPYFVRAVRSPDDRLIKEFEPELVRKIDVSEETLKVVKQGLWGAINNVRGTGFWSRLPGMDFVGKTGTSQVVRLTKDNIYQRCEALDFDLRRHAVFAGFAPVEDPTIAIAVIAEHECHGATGAAPIAKQVISAYLKKYFPEKYTDEFLAEAIKKDQQLQALRYKEIKEREAQGDQEDEPRYLPDTTETTGSGDT